MELKLWRDLRVGELVQVEQNETFPADIVALLSSDSKNQCYIETKNLDGETNLKVKKIHKGLHFLKGFNGEELWGYRNWICFEKPNPYLYKFEGKIELRDLDPGFSQSDLSGAV